LRLSGAVPLGAALQALEDVAKISFAVREYGILVTDQPLPQGAVRLHAFWKAQAGAEKPKAAEGSGEGSGTKNPPTENVEGVVKRVDDNSGLVTISIGSDAGLTKGHTLEVFRLNPPKYLGTIRLLEVKPTESVGKPTPTRQGDKIQSGDRVASRILGS
jgi:hypothetical protein